MVVRKPTAAGKRQLTIEPSGAITRTGRMIPAFIGMSGSRVRIRNISL